MRVLDGSELTGAEERSCWLVHQASNNIDILQLPDSPTPSPVGVEIDYFNLPPVEGPGPAPFISGMLRATALSDRPEVRALISYIASPVWGEVWAGQDTIGETFISSNRRFDTGSYTGDREAADAAVRVRIHEDNRRALELGTWRSDASDLMPLEFSTWTNDYVPGPFWQGMIDWADQVKPVEEILADIQAAREEFDAQHAG